MDILYTLIPLSVVLVFLIIVVLGWAVHGGQFEDLDVEAARIIDDDTARIGDPRNPLLRRVLDVDQDPPAADRKPSRPTSQPPRP